MCDDVWGVSLAPRATQRHSCMASFDIIAQATLPPQYVVRSLGVRKP